MYLPYWKSKKIILYPYSNLFHKSDEIISWCMENFGNDRKRWHVIENSDDRGVTSVVFKFKHDVDFIWFKMYWISE